MEELNPSSRKKERKKIVSEGSDEAKAFGDAMMEMNKLNEILNKMFDFVREVDSCSNCNPSYDP